MSRKYYFISDIHLGRKGQAGGAILSFLSSIKEEAKGLFIIGDLFDFWWEYRTVIPKDYFPFFFRLRELKERGIEVYFLPGNHDWTAGSFLERLGVIVRREIATSLNGKMVFLTHGDFLDDSLLTTFSRFAYRFPLTRLLFSLLHPNFGLPLAKNFISISGGPAWVHHLEKRFIDFATEKIRGGFFLVALGHIHTPCLEKVGDGYYLNTGDWLHHFTYGVLEGEEVGLKRWEGV